MSYRSIVLLCCFVLLAGPVAGSNLYPLASEAILAAAGKNREKDYQGARESALLAPEGGARDFVVGIDSFKLELWEDAARYLGRAADTFPLLADYALYHQAAALRKLGRPTEATAPLQRLLKSYPETPLLRGALLLRADLLHDGGDSAGAYAAYQEFIAKYPAGSDSLNALYAAALCRREMGDAPAAVAALRAIRLKYPAAEIASKAEADLQQLAAQGFAPLPFTPDELYTIGVTLYDLRKYDRAVATLTSIPARPENPAFNARVALKTGQALLKSRRYKEAEECLKTVTNSAPKREIAAEARYWLASTLEKRGKENEAVAAYLALAEKTPSSSLADDALLGAAFVRKFQQRGEDELSLLRRLVSSYPNSNLLQRARWEIAWTSYLSGDFATAAPLFRGLTGDTAVRDKALYWYGRTLLAMGETATAQATFAILLTEYPLGFYAQAYRKEAGLADATAFTLPTDPAALLPLPAGFDRAKALISMGFLDEARRELASAKPKANGQQKTLLGIARLYLEMDDFHGAQTLFRQERPRRIDRESLALWSITHPLAFREAVAKAARKNDLPEWLIYSVIRAESRFLPTAVSPAGAVGLMQVMPGTAKAIRGERGAKSGSLTTPAVNVALGAKHLKDLLVLYRGDVVAAVAAYNAGSGNVSRWKKNLGSRRDDEFIESIPFGETREYVKKVLAGAGVYERLYAAAAPSPPADQAAPPATEKAPPPSPPSATVDSRLVTGSATTATN